MADISLSIPKYVLSSGGQKIPVLGIGTAVDPPVAPEVTKKAVLQAIELGYRHFDTAYVYGSENNLGEAVKEAISLGLIKSRDELFITSKLWCSDAHADCVLPAIQRSLQNLKLEYLNLYLIHWPLSLPPGILEFSVNKAESLPMDFSAVWAAMEECQRLGLTKSIGVSNFSSKKLADILAFGKIPPAVNQVELNPLWNQKKLRDFCNENGIIVTGYSALGAAGTFWGSNRVMESEVLKEIAKAKGKSVAQICLRWAHEIGVTIVVKSFNPERMKENIELFSWSLSEDELKEINNLPQSKGHRGEDWITENGPFKTLEELWDGEIDMN